MRPTINYVSDSAGKPKAVQIPIRQWEKLMDQLNQYEQQLKLKSDITEAFMEIRLMQTGAMPKQTLADFLDEL